MLGHFLRLTIGAAIAVSANVAYAHDYRIGDVQIEHPFTLGTPPGAKNGAAYARLTNTGTGEARLISASSSAAERVELHKSSVENGVSRMRRLEDGLAIPAGETVELAARSYHIMLFGLKRPLVEGEKIKAVLTFADYGDIEVELAVRAVGTAKHSGLQHNH